MCSTWTILDAAALHNFTDTCKFRIDISVVQLPSATPSFIFHQTCVCSHVHKNAMQHKKMQLLLFAFRKYLVVWG